MAVIMNDVFALSFGPIFALSLDIGAPVALFAEKSKKGTGYVHKTDIVRLLKKKRKAGWVVQ